MFHEVKKEGIKMKTLKRKIKKNVRGILASFLMMTTVIWSLGAPLMALIPVVEAADPPAVGQVVISEIKVQEGSDTTKQFIELYNTTETEFDLAGCHIATAPANSTGSLNWTPTSSIDTNNHRTIPGYGYFLFASSGYQPHGVTEDIAGDLNLGINGGYVALRLSDGTVIDYVGYGSVEEPDLCKGGVCALAPGAASIERKAQADSTSALMQWGGAHEFLGNAYDAGATDADDFVLRSDGADDPQRSTFPSESNNFIIMHVMPMGPQTVSVMFNKAIDSATIPADLSTLVTLSTADTTDDETITSVTLKNNNELEIYASGANIDGSTGNDTVAISNILKSTDDDANTSTDAQIIQFYMPPEIMGVKYENKDSIKVIFSKAMEEVSAENASAYGVFVNGAAVTIADTDLSLNIDEDSKVLTITKTDAFADLANDGADYIEVDYDPSVVPKDTEGSELMPTFGWQKEFPIDGTKPYITGGTFDTAAGTVTLYFSEELMPGPDSPVRTASNYTFAGGTASCNAPSSDFKQNIDGPPSFNIVVINCAGGLTLGEGDTVTVSPNITDKAGNQMDDSGTPPKNVFTVAAGINNPIKIASVSGNPAGGSYSMMMDGCMDQYGETGNWYNGTDGANGCNVNVATNRDSLTIVFDGSINPDSINYNSTDNIAYNIGSYLEIYEKHTRAASSSSECQSWEIWNGSDACVEKMMGSLGDSFAVLEDDGGKTNNKLTIYLQGWDVNIQPGMEINPIGIVGMNGLTAQQSDTPADNKFKMDFAEVEAVTATGVTDGSIVTMFFSGDMTRGDITDAASLASKLTPVQHMPYWEEHSWGTDATVAWGDYDGTAFTCTIGGPVAYDDANDTGKDCLKITLGTAANGLTVANKDEIMANGLRDSNGMYLGWGGMIDTTPLAVSNYTWNSAFTELTLEFNKMLRDYNASGDPPIPDFTAAGGHENTIGFTDANTGGVTLAGKIPVFDTTSGDMGGMMMDMFKKIKLTFSGPVEVGDSIVFSSSEIGDENGNIVPDITIVADAQEDLSSGKIELAVDSVGPVLAQVITNDWNSDGVLNGGDEMIFKFDNDADQTTIVSDVDYSTVSSDNLKADFIVKRGSTAVAGELCPADGAGVTTVANPFGEWIDFWVDMWEEHAGELHLNLGPRADIRAGDIICSSSAASHIKDFAGNSLEAGKVLAVIKESRDARINKVVYSDADKSGTLTNGDKFEVYFSSAIDPNTLGAYTAGATPEVTNIDWGLGVEFNWEAGYGSTYDPGIIKTWGNNSTGKWNTDFTQLTITLVCDGACDATDGTEPVLSDFDMVMPYGVQTADGAWVNKPGFIDMTRPVLEQVILIEDSDGDGNADPGDKIILVFSEEMNQTTITGANFAISSGDFGTNPTVNCLSMGVCEVTLDSDAAEISAGATFDPADAVTDLAGLADNTTTIPTLQSINVKPVSNVILSDTDAVYPGIDGRDIDVTWTAPDGADANYTYDIYLLPDFVPFDPDNDGTYTSGENTQFPIAHLSHSNVCNQTACSYIGLAGLMTDSRTAVDTSVGTPQSGAPFFPISDLESYVAYVVAINGSGERSFPQKTSSAVRLTMEYGGEMDDQAPWVEGTMPFDGAIVPTNTAKMGIKFSEPMKRDSIETSGNIKLQVCLADCHLENNWSDVSGVYVSYNADHNKAEISLSSDLIPNAKYRFDIPSPGVEDLSGLAYAGKPAYFRASSGSDTTAPKVIGNSFMFEGKDLNSVSRTEPMVGIAFDKDMDHSSFSTTSVSLTPAVPGSEFYYEPMMMGMGYFFGSPLESGQTYTLTLSGVYIKDVSGNTLDGDGDGTASGTTSDNYTLTFTTKTEDLNTTAPIVNWIFSDGHHIDVGFNADMKKSAVTDKTNWILTDGSGVVVSLQASHFDYDPFMKELHIGPIELVPGQTYTLTPSSSVLGMNNVSVDTANSSLSFVPESWDVVYSDGVFDDAMYEEGGIFGTGGMFHEDTMKQYDQMMGTGGAFDPMMGAKMMMNDAYMDHDIKTFMPIDAWPINQIEGQISNYHISFPTSKAIPHEGKIVLQFPVGFDLTNAALAVDEFMGNNQLFFFNQDINGPGGTMDENGTFNPDGRVQISNVAVNNMDKTITLTIAVQDSAGCTLDAAGAFESACTDTSEAGTNSTMPFDYFDFELSGIKNGSASEIDWKTDTGGYQIAITTKDNNDKLLEGPIKSMKFPIKAAGPGSISGKVTAQDGTTGIANAMVFIDSPMTGPIDTMTGADGTYSVSGLPVSAGNTYDGWYHIHIESPKDDDNYFGGADFDVQLTQDSPTASNKNVRLSSAANTLTVKTTISSALNGEEVMVWVGGPNGHNEKKFTLDSTTDDDAGTDGIQNHLTIKVADGDWDVGIHPFFPETMFVMGPPPPPSFLPPAPKHITVSGDAEVSLSLVSSVAEYEISGIVKDGTTEKGLSNVHVSAFTHFGPGFHSDTETRSDGSFTLKVAPGFYQIEAFKPGLPPIQEQSVEVKDASVSGIELIVHKPNRSISGKVTDGTNPIPHAGVNAWDNNGRFVFGETDTEGEFILFVDPSTSWSVEVFAPGFGKLEADTGVTTTNLDTTSADVTGINFTASNSNIVTISGTVKDPSGNAVEGVKVRADEVAWVDGAEGAMTGRGLSVSTDANGAYALTVPASTANTRYRISATDENSGDLTPITGIDASSNVSSADDSRLNLTLPTTRTITIDIQNAPSDSLLDPDDTTSFFIDKAFLNIYSDTSKKGNSKKIIDTDLSDATDGTLSVPEGSGYRASLYIPGYGEFEATENGSTGFSVSGGNKTIHFDLRRGGAVINPYSIEGQVTASGAGVSNAHVSVINEDTFEVASTQTDADGNYKLKVPDKNPNGTSATYKVRVDKDGYSSSAVKEGIDASEANVDFQMTANNSVITGTVYTNAAKTIPAVNAAVMAKEVGGEGFVKIVTDSEGKFNQASGNALEVASGKTWNIIAKSATGGKGQKMNIPSGSSGIEIVLTDTVAAKNQLSTTPKTESITPASGGVVDQIDTVGAKLTIPEKAFGDSVTGGGVHVTLRETAALPETADFKPLGGIGKDITATEGIQSGKMIDLEFVYKKDKIEAMTETNAENNNLALLDQVRNVYWDDSANNYVPLATTRTVETKAAADSEWMPTDWDDFIAAVSVDKDAYNDYQITLKSATDHFTIFGLKVGSDSTAPSAPTGLAQVSGDGTSVVLDWNDNSEADLMEYEIYRSTSSGVTAINANQVNTSQVAVSNFTDSTTTAWTSYYYTVTAVDDSGNESTVAAEIQVCSTMSVSNGTVAADCTITCDSGYTLSGNSCVAQGGGGGFTGVSVPTSSIGQVAATPSQGGIVSKTNADGTQAKVTLPANALSECTTVTITPVNKATVVISRPVPANKNIIGDMVYNFTAFSGETTVSSFNKAVTITLTYTNAQIEGFNEETLKIYYWDSSNNQWVELADSSVNTSLNTVTATTTHFTYFTIMGEPGEGESAEVPSTVTINDGDLIRAAGDYKVYIIKGIYKRHILDGRIFDFYGHLNWDAVKEVSDLQRDSYQDSALIRLDGGIKVYDVNGDKTKHWLNMTTDQFLATGRTPGMIYTVNADELNFYTAGADVIYPHL